MTIFNLKNKRILITGATGGIGGGLVASMAECGAKIIASGSREDALQELIRANPEADITPMLCNLAERESIEQLVHDTETKHGGIDVLVCNAGITRDALLLRMKDEEWDKVIEINLNATHKLIKSAIKGMLKQRHGRIIIVTSIIGFIGNPGQANYSASKGALTAMAKSIAREVASRGITVNCVAPGFIITPMTDAMPENIKDEMKKHIPLGYFGKPEDVANAVGFLASNESHYITGTTIHVNGGMSML
jgi:3-oxoacyl-[acyl-carrier protein] reductase